MVFRRAKEKILEIKFIKEVSKFFFRNQLKQYINYAQNRTQLIKILEREKNKTRKQIQFPKNIAIIFVGTQKYIYYFPKYYENLKKGFQLY